MHRILEASYSVIVLFLDLLELSSIGAGVPNEVGKIFRIAKDSDASDEAETSWACPEQSVLYKGGHAWAAHERLDELG